MQKNKKNSFNGVSRRINQAFTIPGHVAWTWLAITTAFMSYQWAESQFIGTLPASWVLSASIIVVIFSYFLMDAGLGTNLAIYLDNRKEEGIKRKFLNIVLIVTIIRIIATSAASLWVAPDAASYLTTDHNVDKYLHQISTVWKDNNAMIEHNEKQYQKIAKSADNRIRNAKKRAKTIVKSAINSGNRWQRDSYRREGFNWLNNRANKDRSDHKYVARIKAAQTKADSIIAYEEHKAITADEQLTTLLQDTTTMHTVGLIQEQEFRDRKTYEATLAKRSNIIIFLDLFALFIALISGWISHLHRVNIGEKIDPRSTILILSSAAGKLSLSWIEWLEEFLNVDINGDGHIGKPNKMGKTVTEQKKTVFKNTTGAVSDPARTVVRAFHNKTVTETTPEQSQNVVQQQVNNTPLPVKKTVLPVVTETTPEQKETVPKQVEITKIVIVPEANVDKAIRYARIYYARSISSKKQETRDRARLVYDGHKKIIEDTGKYKITEGPEKVVIEEV